MLCFHNRVFHLTVIIGSENLLLRTLTASIIAANPISYSAALVVLMLDRNTST